MPARSALLTARAEYSARRPIRLERVHIASASRAANDMHEWGGLQNMKQPVSIRDKLASKPKRVFKHLATRERRALYLRRASCDEILPLPRFLAKFYLLSAFFSIVPTLATAPFGVKFHLRSQPVFNRVVCFVVKFYCRPRSVQSPFVYRKTPA